MSNIKCIHADNHMKCTFVACIHAESSCVGYDRCDCYVPWTKLEELWAQPVQVLTPDQEAKHDAGKPQLTLVPLQILYDVARVREYGAVKYKDPDNWKRVSIERYRDALFRHAVEYFRDAHGVDADSGLPHLWHLETNAAFLSELEHEALERTIKEIEDNF